MRQEWAHEWRHFAHSIVCSNIWGSLWEKALASGTLCFRGAARQKGEDWWTLGEDECWPLGLHPPLQAFRHALRSEGVPQPQFSWHISSGLGLGREHGLAVPPTVLSLLFPLSGLHFISNKWVVLVSLLMRFFQPLVFLSMTIKNSQLLEAENKIWPEVNWQCNLIIGVDIFKSLFKKKKKKRLWEKEGIYHGMNIHLSTLEWGLYIFSWKQGAFLLFRESCGYFDAFWKHHN